MIHSQYELVKEIKVGKFQLNNNNSTFHFSPDFSIEVEIWMPPYKLCLLTTIEIYTFFIERRIELTSIAIMLFFIFLV